MVKIETDLIDLPTQRVLVPVIEIKIRFKEDVVSSPSTVVGTTETETNSNTHANRFDRANSPVIPVDMTRENENELMHDMRMKRADKPLIPMENSDVAQRDYYKNGCMSDTHAEHANSPIVAMAGLDMTALGNEYKSIYCKHTKRAKGLVMPVGISDVAVQDNEERSTRISYMHARRADSLRIPVENSIATQTDASYSPQTDTTYTQPGNISYSSTTDDISTQPMDIGYACAAALYDSEEDLSLSEPTFDASSYLFPPSYEDVVSTMKFFTLNNQSNNSSHLQDQSENSETPPPKLTKAKKRRLRRKKLNEAIQKGLLSQRYMIAVLQDDCDHRSLYGLIH